MIDIKDLDGALIYVVESLRNADFTDMDLSRANFRGADLRGSNFSYADLQGADFTGANISDCNFFRAYMVGVILDDAIQDDANFEQTYF